VLNADLQVGPPRTGVEDEVRFGLTSEAGLNDGAAFPFVHLAIALALSAPTGEPWLLDWLTYNVLWEIGPGVGGGYLIGRAFGWITFHIPAKTSSRRPTTGSSPSRPPSFPTTEIIHSYGFLSVFVTALAFRHSHRAHKFHREMHDVAEQFERLAMMVLLLLFGGALVSGLLEPLLAAAVVAAFIILLFVRPAAGLHHRAGRPGEGLAKEAPVGVALDGEGRQVDDVLRARRPGGQHGAGGERETGWSDRRAGSSLCREVLAPSPGRRGIAGG
jgi:sodium/hydrogen antiporter